MALGDKLKELRLKKGLSLQKLADEVGASKAHIWDLEAGNAKNPTFELLVKLSRKLGTSVSELVGEAPFTDNESPEFMALYRDLKDLSPDDRDTIKLMIDRLRQLKELKNESDTT